LLDFLGRAEKAWTARLADTGAAADRRTA